MISGSVGFVVTVQPPKRIDAAIIPVAILMSFFEQIFIIFPPKLSFAIALCPINRYGCENVALEVAILFLLGKCPVK